MDNKAAAASAAWTDGQRSPRRERRSYFTADCLMLPTRANYTDYSCESCMAELYNYKDSVRVIMCWRKRRGGEHVFDGDFSFTSNGSIRRFPTACGALSSLSIYVSTEIFYWHVDSFHSACCNSQ